METISSEKHSLRTREGTRDSRVSMDTEGQKEPKGGGVDGDSGGGWGGLRRAPGGNWASSRPSQGTGRYRELLGIPGGMRRGPLHSLCSFRVSR